MNILYRCQINSMSKGCLLSQGLDESKVKQLSLHMKILFTTTYLIPYKHYIEMHHRIEHQHFKKKHRRKYLQFKLGKDFLRHTRTKINFKNNEFYIIKILFTKQNDKL